MRKRPSAGVVIGTIALCVAVGGGAYAASQLPKNSVGSKQITKNAVGTKEIKKKAVSGKKIRANAVSGSKVRDDSLTGADIDESTLTDVDAARINGSRILQMSYSAEPNTGPQELFSIGGLTVTARCPSAGTDYVELTATTDTSDSIISLPYTVNPMGQVGTLNDFDPGPPVPVQIDDTTATMVYGRGPSSSPIVSADFLANQFSAGGTNGQCKVVGTVVTTG